MDEKHIKVDNDSSSTYALKHMHLHTVSKGTGTLGSHYEVPATPHGPLKCAAAAVQLPRAREHLHCRK